MNLSKALAAASLLYVGACDSRAKEWTAWVYADRDNLAKSETLTGFETFEGCQEAAITKLRSYQSPDNGDYECGYMCRYDQTMQTNICKETRK